MIKLGDKVKDTVSGFTGVAVAEHLYLHGCTRITVQPSTDKDGKLPDTQTFDRPQLEVIKKAAVKEGSHIDGGPDKYQDNRKY